MLYSTAAQVSLVALVVVSLFVLWSGELWARLSVGLHVLNWVLVSLLQHRHHAFEVFQTADFVVDLTGAILAALIALNAKRVWAVSLAAVQWLGVANYFVVFFDHRVMHRAFWTLAYIWEAAALVCLVAGGIAGLRLKRAGRLASRG